MDGSRSESAAGYLSNCLDHLAQYYKPIARFTCLPARWIHPNAAFPIRPESYKSPFPSQMPSLFRRIARVLMPAYCLQDCHYFYRSALRLLNVVTFISPLHA